MTHNYTSNTILKFIYRELPLTEHLEAEYAVATDPEWNKAFHSMKQSISALPKVHFFPSDRVTRSILAYSAE